MVFLTPITNSGCAGIYGYHYEAMPVIEKPTPPVKPKIKSTVLMKDGKYYIGYTPEDAFALYGYLVEEDAHVKMLNYGIDVRDKVIKSFGERRN